MTRGYVEHPSSRVRGIWSSRVDGPHDDGACTPTGSPLEADSWQRPAGSPVWTLLRPSAVGRRGSLR